MQLQIATEIMSDMLVVVTIYHIRYARYSTNNGYTEDRIKNTKIKYINLLYIYILVPFTFLYTMVHKG